MLCKGKVILKEMDSSKDGLPYIIDYKDKMIELGSRVYLSSTRLLRYNSCVDLVIDTIFLHHIICPCLGQIKGVIFYLASNIYKCSDMIQPTYTMI